MVYYARRAQDRNCESGWNRRLWTLVFTVLVLEVALKLLLQLSICAIEVLSKYCLLEVALVLFTLLQKETICLQEFWANTVQVECFIMLHALSSKFPCFSPNYKGLLSHLGVVWFMDMWIRYKVCPFQTHTFIFDFF